MTAAQNTIALKGSPAWGGLLAAAVVALIVAIIAIAISARPVAAPAAAGGAGAGTVVTITGAQQAEAYIESLIQRHNQAIADEAALVPVAAPVPAVGTGAAPVVTITGAQQAEAYMKWLLDRHSQAVGPTQIHPGRPDSPKADPRPQGWKGPYRAQ